MASITYRNVQKSFGDTVVFKDLSIEIEDGEFLVFVGPSGSGKSTALRMLAGLDTITGGEILIDDEVVNNKKIQKRDVAMVFQSYALYPHMSVYKNIAFGLDQRDIDKEEKDRRVHETARTLGIEQFLERRPRDLSGGQRQRVALARAIVREPKAFLLDEPLSNLDAKLRVEARAFLSDLHDDLGATFVYVTHDQVEAMTLGDRIAVVAQNHLQQVDTPSNLYDYPENLFVAGFIGSPAMNFFDAEVTREDGEMVIKADHFTLPAPEDRKHLLEDYVGKEVVIGVRPKDIHHPDYEPADIEPVEIEAEVELVELLGDENVIYLAFGEGERRFAARVDSRVDAERGETMRFVIDLKNVHLFDAKTELVIREDPPVSEHAIRIAEERKDISKDRVREREGKRAAAQEKKEKDEADQKEADQKEADQKEADQKEVDQKEVDQKEPDQKEVDQKEPDQKEPDQRQMREAEERVEAEAEAETTEREETRAEASSQPDTTAPATRQLGELLDEKIEHTIDERIDEKIDEKVDEKVDTRLDKKLDKKVDARLEEAEITVEVSEEASEETAEKNSQESEEESDNGREKEGQ